jgi:hypothetical protein
LKKARGCGLKKHEKRKVDAVGIGDGKLSHLQEEVNLD